MLIDRVQAEGVPPAKLPEPKLPSSNAPSPPVEKQPAELSVSADQVLFSQETAARLGEFRLRSERQNGAAAAIRDTDRAAQEAGQKLDKAKAPLQTIVKNFPPFSPEDKERMNLLRSYTALRKEIDQLTLPPPPAVIEARKLAPLPAPLPMSANDSQIADHLDKLDAAGRALGAFRGDIAADTGAFLQDGRFNDLFSAPEGAEMAGFAASYSESAASQKSAEVGQQFAESVRQGVAVQHPQFLKGLS